jgi:hypothetical protein
MGWLLAAFAVVMLALGLFLRWVRHRITHLVILPPEDETAYPDWGGDYEGDWVDRLIDDIKDGKR